MGDGGSYNGIKKGNGEEMESICWGLGLKISGFGLLFRQRVKALGARLYGLGVTALEA